MALQPVGHDGRRRAFRIAETAAAVVKTSELGDIDPKTAKDVLVLERNAQAIAPPCEKPVSTIRNPEFWDPQIGAYVVLTNTTTCTTGDSGALWLTTMGPNSTHPGDVVAHGQHRGISTVSGYEGCVWVPVNYISSKVQASLLYAS